MFHGLSARTSSRLAEVIKSAWMINFFHGTFQHKYASKTERTYLEAVAPQRQKGVDLLLCCHGLETFRDRKGQCYVALLDVLPAGFLGGGLVAVCFTKIYLSTMYSPFCMRCKETIPRASSSVRRTTISFAFAKRGRGR